MPTFESNTVHGLSGSVEYGHWKAMRQRCNDPKAEKYPKYGGIGVVVCERWDDFAAFLEDMGPSPSTDCSLDRFPNRHGNYEPGNVRWASAVEQTRNRDCTVEVVFEGASVAIAELAERFSIPYGRLRSRLRLGWGVEDAIRKPVRLQRGNNI